MATIEELRTDIDTVYAENTTGEITPTREKAIMHKIVDLIETFGTVFDGDRPITSLPALGQKPGGASPREFLANVFYADAAPGAAISISGGNVREYTGSAEATVLLNWSVTKTSKPITSITVGGVIVMPTGSTESGSIEVTVPANEDTAFQVVVSDGTNSSTKTASLAYRNAMYWGASLKNGITSALTDADILALSKELRTDRLKSFVGIDGNQAYLVFAFPTDWGTPQFIVNGLPNSAYTKVRDNAFENSLGYSKNYQIWVSNTIHAGATNIDIK